ncbi:MAG TPA: universal stress protein [Pyrinomonadaceae bacterium]|nr:universal stress protein [Pyrinomonadaceae bacterium]
MFHKILVGFDGSKNAELALSHALSLSKATGAKVTVLWVRESLPHFPETVDEIAIEEEAAQAYFTGIEEQVQRFVRSQSSAVEVECRRGHPAQQIVECADKGSFDLIVIGNRGHHGFFSRLLGGTADRVSDHAKCDVLIVKGLQG